MKKRYTLDSGVDTTITLEIDTALLPEDLAHEINKFWGGADDVLEASDGDIYQAVARRAAGILLESLISGYNEVGALHELGEREGWPSNIGKSLSIINHDFPMLDSLDFDVTVEE